ncbi:GNAT family N-acetyltransferase [Pseudonocardia humida]|uniref:GNAT family N-acetyltransferase n=1 Tax=Pseudonocardia humida TaxID=2800819 RepID=A0ABT0ZWS0_9PSEU|nr:GNAT family N-acetyltransferase [Pseudonocardia humida]MCO1655194.1 GNAT family N-acetyltransferase [Pseudonocardia humida]
MTTGEDIRVATAADADAIAALHADSWRRTYRGMMLDSYLDGDLDGERRGVWRGRFADPRPDQRVWVAVDGSGLLGFACLFGDGDPTWGAYVDNLHVRVDQRGRGLGLALLRRAAEWTLRERPGAGMWLWVMERNENARGFYRRAGAVEVERTISTTPAEDSAPILRCHWPDPATVATPSPRSPSPR